MYALADCLGTNSVYPQEGSSSQASSQSAYTNRQAVSINTVSASQAGRQVIGGSKPQAGSSQTDNTDYQAVSTDSLCANSVPHQACSSSKVGSAASQAGSTGSQAISASFRELVLFTQGR